MKIKEFIKKYKEKHPAIGIREVILYPLVILLAIITIAYLFINKELLCIVTLLIGLLLIVAIILLCIDIKDIDNKSEYDMAELDISRAHKHKKYFDADNLKNDYINIYQNFFWKSNMSNIINYPILILTSSFTLLIILENDISEFYRILFLVLILFMPVLYIILYKYYINKIDYRTLDYFCETLDSLITKYTNLNKDDEDYRNYLKYLQAEEKNSKTFLSTLTDIIQSPIRNLLYVIITSSLFKPLFKAIEGLYNSNAFLDNVVFSIIVLFPIIISTYFIGPDKTFKLKVKANVIYRKNLDFLINASYRKD